MSRIVYYTGKKHSVNNVVIAGNPATISSIFSIVLAPLVVAIVARIVAVMLSNRHMYLPLLSSCTAFVY